MPTSSKFLLQSLSKLSTAPTTSHLKQDQRLGNEKHFGQGKSLQQHSFTLQALCEVGTYLKAHETQIALQGCPSPSFECPGLLTEHPSYCN